MKYLLLLLLLLTLASCSETSDSATPTASVTAAPPAGPTDIQVMVATDDFSVGKSRVPLIFFNGPAQVSDAKKVLITAFDLSKDPPVAGWNGEATNYSDYAVPYWVVYPELPTAGIWGLHATITKGDGSKTVSQLVIQVNEQTVAPAIGSDPPASQNRTLATEPEIAKLTSGAEPNPDFYQMTIAEAKQNGRPSVVSFSTPGFCQTALCAPVLQSVQAIYPTFKEQVNFIHVEIYKEFTPALVTDDTVLEWQLSSEPWTYVLDEAGKVFTRFGGPISQRELTEALKDVLK